MYYGNISLIRPGIQPFLSRRFKEEKNGLYKGQHFIYNVLMDVGNTVMSYVR